MGKGRRRSSIGPIESPILLKRRHLGILDSQFPRSTSRSVTRGMILWGDMGSESASFALDCRGAEKRRKGETEKPQASLAVDTSQLHINVITLLFGDQVREIGGVRFACGEERQCLLEGYKGRLPPHRGNFNLLNLPVDIVFTQKEDDCQGHC